MYVRQLIGRQAGAIVEMPYHAATSNIAMGTAEPVTDAELAKAGLSLPIGLHEADREAPPPGYRIVACEAGGFDVIDPGEERLNREPLPNKAAARSLALQQFETRLSLAHGIITPVEIPAGWRDLGWNELRVLALNFDPAVRAKEAAVVAVEAELARRSA